MAAMLSPNLTTFFEQCLPIERDASGNTRDSDAYAFQLLLAFASKHSVDVDGDARMTGSRGLSKRQH